jgi:hypothetical protein
MMGLSPIQGVLPTVCRIKKLKNKAHKVQRAVEPQSERERFNDAQCGVSTVSGMYV